MTCLSCQTLCAMLEMEVIDNQDLKMQMITTLQSTCEGKRMYTDLCNRQIALRELVSWPLTTVSWFSSVEIVEICNNICYAPTLTLAF